MNPHEPQNPWDAIRSWPEHRPLVCSLDLAPDAPSPGVTLAEPVQYHDLDLNAPIEGLRALLATNPTAHRALWLAYETGNCIDQGVGPTTNTNSVWKPGQVIDLTSIKHLALHADHSLSNPDLASEWALELDDPTNNRQTYLTGVCRILDYIRAGDVYQVNLTHHLHAVFTGSPRDFAATLFASAKPWHGAYIETMSLRGQRQVIISASPELFLDLDATTRRVRTRPMKGTRPVSANDTDLFNAEKDRAELNMIVDLMRNDLGRVCAFGSMEVTHARTIERHGDSVLQATATIEGRLRANLDLADVIGATFPPGSVTGTPKIRAMQIIDELESVSRAPYCGFIGTINPDRTRLNVAIRTALLTETATPGVWDFVYPVGAGIVADSDPQAEWQETLDKAHILTRLAHENRAASRNRSPDSVNST